MRTLAWIGSGLVMGTAFLAFVSGCSSDSDDSAQGYPSDGVPSGSGGAVTAGGSGGGTSYDGGAYGGSGGASSTGGMGASYAGEADGQRPPEGIDAGEQEPDGGVSCSDLDSSQPEVLYLSADDSNSMASPAIARRIIREFGGIVPSGLIRTYEFLNYYNVPFESPAAGELRVVPQMRPGAADGDMELQIGVQAAAPASPRRSTTITFVLDTSGSMSGSPISLMRDTVKAIAANLRQGDIVSAVTWNTGNNVVLSGHQVSGPSDPVVVKLATDLSANGGTDLHSGLVAGYQLAEQHFGNDRINRVVLVSDGNANVGITDETLIGEKADDQNKEGIYLVGVGVGSGVNDTLMDAVTDAGNGAYVYIDTPDEAMKMFSGRFAETMDVAARAVQVKLTLPWYFQMYKFHGEEYSGDPKKVKPQHLAPGDAMVFHQVLRACDAAEILGTDTMEFAATWVDPVDYSERTTQVSSTIDDLLEGQGAALKRGRAIVAYAETLKLVPSQDVTARGQTIDAALAVVAEADPEGKDPEMSEIHDLLIAYQEIVAK